MRCIKSKSTDDDVHTNFFLSQISLILENSIVSKKIICTTIYRNGFVLYFQLTTTDQTIATLINHADSGMNLICKFG